MMRVAIGAGWIAVILGGLGSAVAATGGGAHVGVRAADLVVVSADVLDVAEGRVQPSRTIVVRDGRIADVLGPGDPVPAARDTLAAEGGTVTPGIVDMHGHLAFVLGDSVSSGGGFITRLRDHPDSLAAYRRRYARAHLPHGVTTVRDVGSAEDDLRLLASWMEPGAGFPGFLPSGGALVTPDPERVPFPGHEPVADPAAAAAKVREYHRAGYRDVKLYWRLREPELRAALDEARRLDVRATAHVDFHVLPFGRALDLGVRSFEHAYTVGIGALSDAGYAALWQRDVPAVYGARRRGLFHLAALEAFHRLGPADPDMEALVRRLAATGSSVSSTLHIFAQQAGVARFRAPTGTPFDDVSGLTPEQRRRARAGYGILEGWVRRMHEAGVRLTLGTDWTEPGRVALSEIALLHRAGIPMADAFRIATLNGAEVLGMTDEIGRVAEGLQADLVVFRGDPLEDPNALFGEKIVVEDGVVVR